MTEKKTKKAVTRKTCNIEKSPNFKVIMDQYQSIGWSMSIIQFYQSYVSVLDPQISLRQWQYFCTRLNKKVSIESEKIVQRMANKNITVTQMEEASLKKIIAIGDLTLDEVVNNPELLSSVPLTQRMTWLFSAFKARDSRMVAATKAHAEKRKTSMYEDMLLGAQYGAIDAEEIEDEGNVVQPVSASPDAPEAQKTPIPEAPAAIEAPKIVEFTPDSL